MIDLLAAFTWDPGFRGMLTVLVAVVVLCGSVFLILSTNSGSRLGFLIALTGFCGWMFVMGIIWSLYGIGYKGASPSWNVVDVVRSEPDSGQVDSTLEVADTLPLPSDLEEQFGTPVEIRDADEELLTNFPTTQRDPNFGDLVTIDTQLQEQIDDEVDPWRILETSNKYTGETQAVVGEALGPDGQAVFESASDYVVVQSFLTGGKDQRTNDSILGRVAYKFTSTADITPDPFYAAVQLQEVIPQDTRPGQAPPSPVRDPNAPIITVVMQRVDTHQLRVPQITMTVLMGIATAVLCNVLHRRDKLAQAQRAAAGAS